MRALLAGLAGRRRFVVATSGGPDSQALLHWSVRVAAQHNLVHLGAVGVDHGLRVEAADELSVVRRSCRALGVNYVQRTLSALPPGNVMQAARLARRRALRRAALALGAEAVLLGHTADDQAETVLQHLARGAGLAGACGMPVARGDAVRFVRPWLGVTRPEVEAYVAAHALSCAQDPSNADARRSRVAVRRQVLPALCRPYPNGVRHLAAFAARATLDEALLKRLAARALRRCQTPTAQLALPCWRRLDPALRPRVLRRWLLAHGGTPDARALGRLSAELASAPSSGTAQNLSCGALRGVTVVREVRPAAAHGEVLRALSAAQLPPRRAAAAPTVSPPAPVPLLPGAPVAWGPWRVQLERTTVTEARLRCTRPGGAHAAVAFAAGTTPPSFCLRGWREGDRLRPFGLDGSTKVGELFINAKVPRAHRRSWPVLTLGGELAWVVGLRRASLLPLGRAEGAAWVICAHWCGRGADPRRRMRPAACAAGVSGYTVDVI